MKLGLSYVSLDCSCYPHIPWCLPNPVVLDPFALVYYHGGTTFPSPFTNVSTVEVSTDMLSEKKTEDSNEIRSRKRNAGVNSGQKGPFNLIGERGKPDTNDGKD